jgi:RNA polymerase sigma factor (sigma-70 family)
MTPLTPEQRHLFDTHLHLVQSIVKRWPPSLGALSRDDLESVGAIGLLDAVTRHNGHSSFASYARIRIRGAVVDEIRRMAPGTRETRPVVLQMSDDLVGQLEENDCGESYSAESLEQVIHRLNPRQAELVRMRLRGLSQKEIALNLGRSQVAVSLALKGVREKLARNTLALPNIRRDKPIPKNVTPVVTVDTSQVSKARAAPLQSPRYRAARSAPSPVQPPFQLSLYRAVELLERRYVDRAMRMAHGNKAAAARLIGLNRTTLVEMLKRQHAKDSK